MPGLPAKIIGRLLSKERCMRFSMLLAFGERSLNLKRAINNKLGATRKDDRLPKIASRVACYPGPDGFRTEERLSRQS